jgi:hypothetical protein
MPPPTPAPVPAAIPHMPDYHPTHQPTKTTGYASSAHSISLATSLTQTVVPGNLSHQRSPSSPKFPGTHPSKDSIFSGIICVGMSSRGDRWGLYPPRLPAQSSHFETAPGRMNCTSSALVRWAACVLCTSDRIDKLSGPGNGNTHRSG